VQMQALSRLTSAAEALPKAQTVIESAADLASGEAANV